MTAHDRVQLILMEERLHAVTGEQLTFSQLKLLKLVARTESYKISEVASFLGVSNAAASKAVDRLVRRNLLRRRESEDDRRAVELSLTERGQRLLEEYDELTNQTLEEIFHGFAPDGLRKAAEFLDELSISVVEHDGDPDEACFRCSIFFRDKCLLRTRHRGTCHFVRKMREEAVARQARMQEGLLYEE
jgi:DNA-binding MarR family transcriptional regulator